jgi:hypothetical protein
MQIRWFLALAAAMVVAVGCSTQQNATQGASPPPPPLRNPLDFALYPGANIISARAFTQNIIVQNGNSSQSIFRAGSGTYAGREVIAASSASFGELSSWVERLAASPPAGYSAIETGLNPQATVQARKYGVDYVTFKKKEGTHTRGVLVVVMDPQQANKKFGRVLNMIAKYRALPAVMRAPIDNEAKARLGMSITEATAPDSPIGAALGALDQFEHRNSRGILIIDAAKR